MIRKCRVNEGWATVPTACADSFDEGPCVDWSTSDGAGDFEVESHATAARFCAAIFAQALPFLGGES